MTASARRFVQVRELRGGALDRALQLCRALHRRARRRVDGEQAQEVPQSGQREAEACPVGPLPSDRQHRLPAPLRRGVGVPDYTEQPGGIVSLEVNSRHLPLALAASPALAATAVLASRPSTAAMLTTGLFPTSLAAVNLGVGYPSGERCLRRGQVDLPPPGSGPGLLGASGRAPSRSTGAPRS